MALSDQDILDFVGENPGAGRDAIRKGVAQDVSETTIWRLLKRLVEEGRLEVSGKGRATGYRIAGGAVVRAHLSTPYNRRVPVSYRPEFLDAYVPGKTWYLHSVLMETRRVHAALSAIPVKTDRRDARGIA
jgi:hypothetical protein